MSFLSLVVNIDDERIDSPIRSESETTTSLPDKWSLNEGLVSLGCKQVLEKEKRAPSSRRYRPVKVRVVGEDQKL